jgi:DNA adenine methylase
VPFLKWAGGKSRLLPDILETFPRVYGTYYEPFLGGGAVFLALRPARARLSDTNAGLINCWEVVRDHPRALMSLLDEHVYESAHYYRVRALRPESLDPVERAARLIYLNKTCYNGLYRVNSKGEFNVPIGRFGSPPILYDRDTLCAISALLRRVELGCAPFHEAVAPARSGDLVYFDPPYRPLSKTSAFTSYTEERFTDDDQARLARVALRLRRRGCRVIVSNSDTPEVRRLFGGFRMRTVLAARSINSKTTKRGRIPELLISAPEA